MHVVPALPVNATVVRRRRAATVAAGTAGVGWVVVTGVLARNEQVAAAVPIGCPFKALTGLDCPGCGSTRSLGAITRFDLAAAFDHNVLVPFALVFVVASFVAWTLAVWRRPVGPIDVAEHVAAGPPATPLPARLRRPSLTVTIAVVVVAFAVTRNLEVADWLASGRTGT